MQMIKEFNTESRIMTHLGCRSYRRGVYKCFLWRISSE